jgi:hypothetical protein
MNKETKHTPGPWNAKLGQFDFGNDGERYVVHRNEDHPHSQICIVASQIERNRKTPHDAEDQERDANARLIASAPDLLEALEYWIDIAQHDPKYAAWLGKARAALSKTKGTQ